MINRKQVFITLAIVLLVWLLSCVSADDTSLIHAYDRVVFYPFQSLRAVLFGYLPFSIGDVIYVAAGVFLVVRLVFFARLLFRFQSKNAKLLPSLMRGLNIVLCAYLFFLLGWGLNYNKQPLGKEWGLDAVKDTFKTAVFDSVLVDKINAVASGYHDFSAPEVNKICADNYRTMTSCGIAICGTPVKPSFFSWFLERLGIDGYYNPFTGEGQVSSRIPHFMLPFVVTHEMAHQAGIAAEGDANLLAYAIGTQSSDASFRYSAYLNIWLYADRRLFRKDSMNAKRLKGKFNKMTLAQLDTLDELSKLYDNDATRYSSGMYDDYLKLHHQKEGIRSYGNVMIDAWRLEKKGRFGANNLIFIP